MTTSMLEPFRAANRPSTRATSGLWDLVGRRWIYAQLVEQFTGVFAWRRGVTP
jgi:hypothetical protein